MHHDAKHTHSCYPKYLQLNTPQHKHTPQYISGFLSSLKTDTWPIYSITLHFIWNCNAFYKLTQVCTTLGHQMPLPGGIEGACGGDGVGVHLTKHQPDPQADDMSCWPVVVPLLTIRCLYWEWGGVVGIRKLAGGVGGVRGIGGYIWKMKTVYCKVLLKTSDGLLQTIEHELR